MRRAISYDLVVAFASQREGDGWFDEDIQACRWRPRSLISPRRFEQICSKSAGNGESRTDKLVLPSARDFDHSIGRDVLQTVFYRVSPDKLQVRPPIRCEYQT